MTDTPNPAVIHEDMLTWGELRAAMGDAPDDTEFVLGYGQFMLGFLIGIDPAVNDCGGTVRLIVDASAVAPLQFQQDIVTKAAQIVASTPDLRSALLDRINRNEAELRYAYPLVSNTPGIITVET